MTKPINHQKQVQLTFALGPNISAQRSSQTALINWHQLLHWLDQDLLQHRGLMVNGQEYVNVFHDYWSAIGRHLLQSACPQDILAAIGGTIESVNEQRASQRFPIISPEPFSGPSAKDLFTLKNSWALRVMLADPHYTYRRECNVLYSPELAPPEPLRAYVHQYGPVEIEFSHLLDTCSLQVGRLATENSMQWSALSQSHWQLPDYQQQYTHTLCQAIKTDLQPLFL